MKTITIKSNGLGRYDDVSPFILTDGKLELRFILPLRNGQFFFVAENNETKYKKFISDEGKVFLDGLTAGELNTEIKHYLRGELIESYKIEPLLLRQLDNSCAADPVIAELIREVEALKEENKNLREKIENKTENILRQINNLRQFAKSCISVIPYINDLKIEEDN